MDTGRGLWVADVGRRGEGERPGAGCGIDDVPFCVGCWGSLTGVWARSATVFWEIGKSYSWPFTIPPCVGVMAPTSATVSRGSVVREVGYVAAIHPLRGDRDS